jgi:hypothetical protein
MKVKYFGLILLFLLLLSACAPRLENNDGGTSRAQRTPSLTKTTKPTQVEIPAQLTPVNIPGYHRMIPFDGIAPIYNPQFVTAGEAPYQEDELVIGVALEGEAKAYPISVLRFREMVNDKLAGTPVLVTW